MTRLLFSLIVLSGFYVGMHAQGLEDAREETYRIMSYNIRSGRGMDNVINLQRIVDVINRTAPDVVAVQEVDSLTMRSGQVDVLRVLANETRMYPVYAPAIPHDEGKYGVGMLSKEKPIGSYQIPLPGREEERTLLVVEFDKFVMACTHFSLTEEDRMTSVGLICREAAKANKPFVLAGDLNARPDSPVMKELGKEFVLLSDSKQLTAPANNPRSTIDYIAAYKVHGVPFTVLHTFVEDEPVASDHRPVVVDVRIQTGQ